MKLSNALRKLEKYGTVLTDKGGSLRVVRVNGRFVGVQTDYSRGRLELFYLVGQAGIDDDPERLMPTGGPYARRPHVHFFKTLTQALREALNRRREANVRDSHGPAVFELDVRVHHEGQALCPRVAVVIDGCVVAWDHHPELVALANGFCDGDHYGPLFDWLGDHADTIRLCLPDSDQAECARLAASVPVGVPWCPQCQTFIAHSPYLPCRPGATWTTTLA